MYTILALALLTNNFDMIGEPTPTPSLVMIGCAPPKQEETDDEATPDASVDTVVVYLDLNDRKTLARIAKDCDSIEGLKFSFRDSSRIPAEGHRYQVSASCPLPLLQYHTDRGWVFDCGWKSAIHFANRWVAGNSGKELQAKNQDVSVGSSERRNSDTSVRYPIRGSWWTGCSSWHHMTQGEHAGKFNADWLKSLSWSELQSLHSDDHEHRVKVNYINRTPVAVSSPPVVSSKPKKKSVGLFGQRGYYCPSGNCPWN